MMISLLERDIQDGKKTRFGADTKPDAGTKPDAKTKTNAETRTKPRAWAWISVALTQAMLLGSICGIGSASANAELLRVPGTGACEVVLRELAATFNGQDRNHQVEVPPSTGSGGGIRSVMEERAVMARVARPLKEDEAAGGLKYRPFAKDPVLFVAGSGVTVSNLSTSQIVDIFSGKVRNWQEVGGGDAPIRVLTRELDDSSLMVIRQHISQFATMGFPASSKCVYHDYEMIEALTKYRYSIGWLTGSSYLSIKNSVSVLAVDGVSPTVRNILAGSYKLVEQYALVYKRGALAGTARSFLRFLFSIEGKARMSEFGLIPSDEG